MFISEDSKFKVEDSVVLRNNQYRGNWRGYNLAGGNKIEYVGDDTFLSTGNNCYQSFEKKLL